MPSSGKVLVLDRDGTIVVDKHFLSDPEELEFLPFAAEGLRAFAAAGYRFVVITNQSGVGRGLFSLQRLEAVNDRFRRMIGELGLKLANIYYCPHAPEEDCDCRKPRPGLLQRAARELDFDPSAAVVIGDKGSDVEMGRRVGATTVLIAAAASAAHPMADFIAPDLLDAATQLSRRPA
jgi:D-glycero-D-manno-heptose 1,7-bisphosphate phosphatase